MTSDYSAVITFPDNPKEAPLELNFEPIIKTFNLDKLQNFVLLHWQARPKLLRGYGCYDFATKKYHCTDWDKTIISKLQPMLMQVDDNLSPPSPSAVLFFPGKLQYIDDKWRII